MTLDGTEDITCVVKKPDGNIVSVAVPNTSSNNVVVTTTLQMTACSGNSVGVLNISKGGVNLYTLNFILYCERNPLENGIESESSIHDLQAQIADAVADQYDSNNVIFDNTGTAGHGIGYAVTSEGILTMVNGAIALIPVKLSDLSDVNINNPQANQALIFDLTDPDNPVIKNGTVSTVGNLDDLNDVDTTGKQEGDSLRYIGGEWKAKPTTVEMTQAEYDAIVDFTPYANTHIVITNAPNLNPTASDIEYTSGVTVADELNNKADKTGISFSKTLLKSVTTTTTGQTIDISGYDAIFVDMTYYSSPINSAFFFPKNATAETFRISGSIDALNNFASIQVKTNSSNQITDLIIVENFNNATGINVYGVKFVNVT